MARLMFVELQEDNHKKTFEHLGPTVASSAKDAHIKDERLLEYSYWFVDFTRGSYNSAGYAADQ